MLECAHPRRPRIGYSRLPTQDPVRFCQEPAFAFAAATIHSLTAHKLSDLPPRMAVQFFGLLGSQGPMPLHFTRLVRERRSKGDKGLLRFCDLFHHRMTSLFYRAWAAHQRVVAFDRPRDDPFVGYVGSLFGIGTSQCRNRDEIPDVAKLHFAGRLACPTRHAEGLAAILSAYFTVPVEIEQFVGQWIDIPHENRLRLGETPETGMLGRTAILGARTWDVQQRFRVRMGPMKFDTYERLFPVLVGAKRLRAWVRQYAGLEVTWDAQLVLKATEVPQVQLGRVGHLGWSTWLLTKKSPRHRGDLTIDDDLVPAAGADGDGAAAVAA
jgi:type VI secretion system protein ImpH